MGPADADEYFGRVMRWSPSGTRLARCQALTTFLAFLELRDKVEIYQLTGRVLNCPIDEVNPPRRQGCPVADPADRGGGGPAVHRMGGELVTCRKFAPAARNYTAAALMAGVGLRVKEACRLDLSDIKWELDRFGKLHVRYGKGARGAGPRERMVRLINDAGRVLRWFIEDVWGRFDDDHTRPGAPLFPSERRNADGTARRVGDDAVRAGLAGTAAAYLPGLADTLTPPVLPHYCASELYLNGLDLISIQEVLGHHDAVCPRTTHPGRRRLDGGERTSRTPFGRTAAMRWNLRLTAASKGIWKASELQRRLAEHGLVISAGRMSGLWSGQPVSVKLDDLDVICVALDCQISDLLIPQPETVARPGQDAAAASAGSAPGPSVVPKRRDGRSLPPA